MDSTVSYSPHSGSGRVRITFLEADPDSNVLMQKTCFFLLIEGLVNTIEKKIVKTEDTKKIRTA